MQYLWAVTFVARQGSLRWPQGLAHRGVQGISDTITHHLVRVFSPASSAQRYSSSCDRSKLQALFLRRRVSEWFMVIYIVGHACSCLFSAGVLQFLLYSEWSDYCFIGWSIFLHMSQMWIPMQHEWHSDKINNALRKNCTEPYWHIPVEMAKSQWPQLYQC